MGRQTQTQAILNYLEKHGSITGMDAFNHLGISALASRISDLRKRGIPIGSVTEESQNRYGSISRYSRYFIKDE